MSIDPQNNTRVEFQIISEAADNWHVQFRIRVAELLDQQALLQHLRAVKRQIAQKYSVSETCMRFDGIVNKTRTHHFVDVVVRIKKIMHEKGHPSVHISESRSTTGELFSDMVALLDLYYLDDNEQPVTEALVMQAIRESGVYEELLDKQAILRSLKDVIESQSALRNVPIAHGLLPDDGAPAELEFFFANASEPMTNERSYLSRQVYRGDLLCRKTPPQTGGKPGYDVYGRSIARRPGPDIILRTESGASLNRDCTEISAEVDGVAVIVPSQEFIKDPRSGREIPKSLTIKVNSVMKVEGGVVLDISTSGSVEVSGSVMSGSKILTDCEVFVSGDVADGAVIEAGDNVTIQGGVSGASVTSESSIVVQKDVTGSNLQARSNIVINGEIKNSSITGEEITADAASGSRIIARRRIVLERINADESGVLSTISVGMRDFFAQRMHENELFIEKTRENLMRIEMIVGSEIIEQVNVHNTQAMLMKYLAQHRIAQSAHTRRQVDIYRRLVESICPTKALIVQKERENRELERILSEDHSSDHNVVIVREQMVTRTVFSVDGAAAEVATLNCPAELHRDADGQLIIEHLTEPDPKDPAVNPESPHENS
jgi:uncharacterized protein (DUF342 family)